MELLQDLWKYFKERKKLWLAPMIVILLLVGLLIIAGGTSAGTFIYTIF